MPARPLKSCLRKSSTTGPPKQVAWKFVIEETHSIKAIGTRQRRTAEGEIPMIGGDVVSWKPNPEDELLPIIMMSSDPRRTRELHGECGCPKGLFKMFWPLTVPHGEDFLWQAPDEDFRQCATAFRRCGDRVDLQRQLYKEGNRLVRAMTIQRGD